MVQNGSIVKGFQVLEAFNNSGHASLTLFQLVALTGLEKSAVQRFTATFVELGYLRKDPLSRHYAIAPKLLNLGTSYVRGDALIARSVPYLLEWSREHNETINLMELDDLEVIVVYRLRTRRVMTTDVSIGSYEPWYATATGQAIAACLPDDVRADMIRRTNLVPRATKTITDRKKLAARLAKVRGQGYAVCAGEYSEHDIGIAAPVFDANGHPIASVGAVVQSPGWSARDAEAKLAASVCLLARSISGLSGSATAAARASWLRGATGT